MVKEKIMKKSEFKEYLKNEVLKMTEATDEDIAKQKELNAELEKTRELMGNMEEGKIKKSEFKEYLRNEILAEIAEQETEEEFDVEDETSFEFEPTGEASIDDITDGLVDLAKKAKDAGQTELANQILNSAKFSAKTEFKKIAPET